MHPSTICVNAGVVIRSILFPENIKLHQLWAGWILNDNQIFVPTLLPFEVINVFYRYHLNLLPTHPGGNLRRAES